MNPKALAQFKDCLLSQRDEVLGRMKNQDHTKKANLEHEVGDHGGDATLEALEPLVESESHLVEKIDFALQRITTGGYGTCTACSKEIPFSRLEAKPSVSLCLDCQSEHETEA